MICAACGATRLKILRPGVARVREELEALLGVPVGEVSGSGRAASGTEPLPDVPVVVGTGAVLYRTRHAGAVAFLDFDQHLLAATLHRCGGGARAARPSGSPRRWARRPSGVRHGA